MAFSAFCYSPLLYPETEIRLLNFSSEAQTSNSSIFDLNIETFPLQDAPPYAAMSYTWSDPPAEEIILIRGLPFYIRWNCWYMLRQLQKHRPFGYFWIDAICINQDDVDEKNCQVQMMGEIYEHAECVIASLGEHADDSRLLFEHLGDLNTAIRAHDTGHESGLYKSSGSLGNEMEACTAYGFGMEFNKGDWQDKPNPPCHGPEDHVTYHNQIQDFTKIKRYLGGELGILHSVLTSYRSSGASDKRDHIYGFRRLIQWPLGTPAIQVDYSVPALVVAERLMTYFEPVSANNNLETNAVTPSTFARRILLGLHIDGADEDLRDMLEKREQPRVTHPATLPRTISTQSHTQYRQKVKGPSYRLILDPLTGCLQAPIRRINGSNKSQTLYALSLHRETRNWHDYYELRERLPPDLQPPPH
ncbi:hypothetical protein KC354_g12589 [Hortaea werneckii]|nr:hypothetical protein KC354_g12589 [Hortaea werneckii]